jgi:hypothetical protein
MRKSAKRIMPATGAGMRKAQKACFAGSIPVERLVE